jgi:hypothetical protein
VHFVFDKSIKINYVWNVDRQRKYNDVIFIWLKCLLIFQCAHLIYIYSLWKTLFCPWEIFDPNLRDYYACTCITFTQIRRIPPLNMTWFRVIVHCIILFIRDIATVMLLLLPLSISLPSKNLNHTFSFLFIDRHTRTQQLLDKTLKETRINLTLTHNILWPWRSKFCFSKFNLINELSSKLDTTTFGTRSLREPN